MSQTPIADTLDDLTPDWFTSALREGGTLGPEASVTRADCHYIGTGQLGSVALAQLTYDGASGAPATLVVKQPSTDAGSRGLGAQMGVYRSEVRFYEEVAPLVAVAAPGLHWSALEEDTGRFTLILDDLSDTAVVGDMMAGATPDQVRLALEAVVELQAPLWDDPRATERPWLADLGGTRMLFGAVPTAVEPFRERFGDRVGPERLALVERLAPRAPEVVDKVFKPPFVVAHGDYRLDNMMFGTAPGAPGISVLDWQACRLGPPGLDAAIFLSSCLDADTRRASERDALQVYADGLAAAGVTGFGFDDVWESYREASLYPFLLCVFTSITLEQTERGDAMWTQLLSGAADLVADLDAGAVLD
jgi:hypothetical protein